MKQNVTVGFFIQAATALLLVWFGTTPAKAHEEVSPVIVDTDMALDDVRALGLLLGAHEVQVRAIVTSDGACPPAVGASNALRVLHALDREFIPVGAGRLLNQTAPPWAAQSVSLGGADLPLPSGARVQDAQFVLESVLTNATQPLTWICLGPLSNLADFLEGHPEATNQIAKVYLLGGPPDASRPGWNTTRDMEAARKVFDSGIGIVAIHLLDAEMAPFDSPLFSQIEQIDAPAARLILQTHAHQAIQQLIEIEHMRIWDETAVLLFLEPGLAHFHQLSSQPHVSVLESIDQEAVRSAYLEELQTSSGSEHLRRPMVALKGFPLHSEEYQTDLEPLVDEIIARYGIEEWKLNVLTSELHRHLGLYSIVGAKMGLRARELLNASLDEVRVESLAGLNPPVSCLNDGLQVSTGASLGRGTILVETGSKPLAAAIFTKDEQQLRLQLKEDAVNSIQQEIRAAIKQHGNLTPAYFAEVRRIALQAWLNLDRNQIFDETFLTVENARAAQAP